MIKDFFYRLLFQDKINDLKNVTLAYASARKTLREISLETSISKIKDRAEAYFRPNSFYLIEEEDK